MYFIYKRYVWIIVIFVALKRAVGFGWVFAFSV